MTRPSAVEPDVDDPLKYMVYGTYEDALAWIGRETEAVAGDVPVDWGMVLQFCGITEDTNPSYWDRDFAEQQWGGLLSPPAMLITWAMALPWTPQGCKSRTLHCLQIPLPGNMVINRVQESEFFEPARVGDQITMTEVLTDLTPEKNTALGPGHFLTTVATFRRDDTTVGTLTNVLLRFTASTGARP